MFRITKALISTVTPIKVLFRYSSFPANFVNLIKNMPAMEYCKMFNGLNVATEERECYNACIGYFFDTGSRYEEPSENGISHLFEHLIFKGTADKSKTVLENQISSTGARLHYYTTREIVGFYAECLREDVPCIFKILTDCFFKNSLNPCEIEIQKNIVYREMLEHDKNTKDLIDDYLHSAAFQGTPLAQTIMGTTCNLCNFKRETICNYRAKNLDPSRIALVAVGGVKHEQILQLAGCLEALPYGQCMPPQPSRYTGSDIRYRDDSMSIAHVAIAVEGPHYCSPYYIDMSLASTIIGGWDKSQPGGMDLSSRVARSASVSQLCESYKTINISYKDTGLWGIQFISPKLVAEDMASVVLDEWMRLCTIVTEGELERAKAELRTKVLTNNESTTKTCLTLGRWVLYRQYKTSLYERLCDIDAVNIDDIKKACYKYIYDKCPVVVAIGATECVPDYARIKAGMYWLRY